MSYEMDDDEEPNYEPFHQDGGDEDSSSEDHTSSPEDEYSNDLRRQAPLAERRAPRQLWLISYSDFMTILMIFFLAMYGYTYLAKASLINAYKKNSNLTFAELMSRLEEDLGEQVKIEEGLDKVTLQVGEAILFPSGRSNLVPSASRTLDDLANTIKLVPGEVIVEGHTDNIPIVGGRFRSNWELSAARAFSVIEALIERDVPAERLGAWGFGENRPLASNDSSENRAKNRRIEIVILKEGKEGLSPAGERTNEKKS